MPRTERRSKTRNILESVSYAQFSGHLIAFVIIDLSRNLSTVANVSIAANTYAHSAVLPTFFYAISRVGPAALSYMRASWRGNLAPSAQKAGWGARLLTDRFPDGFSPREMGDSLFFYDSTAIIRWITSSPAP
jgi:hypothetical protein